MSSLKVSLTVPRHIAHLTGEGVALLRLVTPDTLRVEHTHAHLAVEGGGNADTALAVHTTQAVRPVTHINSHAHLTVEGGGNADTALAVHTTQAVRPVTH